MHAFVMTGLGVGGVDTIDDPTPAAGEAVVAPVVSGLCGTDVHLFHEGTMLDPADLPLVLGHELIGEVVDPGTTTAADGSSLSPGALVAVEPVLPCGTCRACVRGLPNHCRSWTHLGITRHGGWAELMSAPTARLTPLPEGLTASAAALAEPLACAVNFVLDRGALRAGETVLVLGAGPIGLLCALVARAAGAACVIVSEPNPGRRRLARACDADLVVDPLADDLAEAVAGATAGFGADLVIEATGVPRAIAQAVDIAAPGSRIVLAGLGSGAAVGIDTNAVALKELDLRGGFASRWAMGRGLALLATGAISTAALVTSERSWADAVEAMDAMQHDADTCKIVLRAPGATS